MACDSLDHRLERLHLNNEDHVALYGPNTKTMQASHCEHAAPGSIPPALPRARSDLSHHTHRMTHRSPVKSRSIASSPNHTRHSSRERTSRDWPIDDHAVHASQNHHNDANRHSRDGSITKPRRRSRICAGLSSTSLVTSDSSGSAHLSERSRYINTSSSSLHTHRQRPLAHDAAAVSLTSASTISPAYDDAHTPYAGSPALQDTAIFAPLADTASSDQWSMLKHGSTRSQRTVSSRHASIRRQSKRSLSSSHSPALAFLSRWTTDSATAPEPDDEGQSFGLRGEYTIGRQLGYGGFSVVKEAYTLNSQGQKAAFAVKIVRKTIDGKTEIESEDQQHTLAHELGIWRHLTHKHILALHDVFENDSATFCIMDLNTGGSLYDLILAGRKSGTRGLGLDLAKRYAFQLASALRYLHQDIHVVHRDVKLENCLIDTSNCTSDSQPGLLRLCDFGLADFEVLDSPCIEPQKKPTHEPACVTTIEHVTGSLDYAAPEMLTSDASRNPSPAVDIWAFGICVYALLTGERPFKHTLHPKLVELILQGSWDEELVSSCVDGNDAHIDTRDEVERREGLRKDILELLVGCLCKDVGKRFTITKVLASPWFADCGDAV